MTRPKSLPATVPVLLRVLRHFAPWIRAERKGIAVSMAALLAGVTVRLAEPWPLKLVLDRVIPTERPAGMHTLAVIEDLDATTLLTLCAVALVAVTLIRAVCEYHQKVGFARIGNRVLRQVRDHVFFHVQRLSLSFHTKARAGDLIVRVTRDVSLLRDVASTALLPMLANVLVLIGMGAVMLLLSWQLALLAMVTLPFFLFTTSRTTRSIHAAARKQRQREGAMAATAAESISSMRVVQALSLEDSFAEGFSSKNSESQKEDLKAARLSAKLGRTVDVLLAISTALVLWFGGSMILATELTPGDLLVFLTYLKRAFNPAKDFAKYAGRLAKAAAAGERVVALLERVPDVRDRSDAVAVESCAGALTFRGVGFGYEPDHPVLDQLDLEIPAGCSIALVGPSGVGKSTVLSLVMRLYDPVSGSVQLDGRDLRELTVASLRAQMAVVLQDTVLFSGTVAENIAHAVSDATPERVEAAARLADAHAFITALPDGYGSVVGERGATLSHGQRQRIAIARAAMRPAPILILDEPTTGLDEASQRAVVEALDHLIVARTTLMVTHDLALAQRADRIIVLGDGKVVEQGPPDELLASGGSFARWYALQRKGAVPHAT